METETIDLSYERPLSSLNGLTDSTFTWMVRNRMVTIGDLLKKGYQGCTRLMNCGEKRLKEIQNFVEDNAEVEYDFFMRPVSLPHREIEDLQSGDYSNIKLNHLSLSKLAMNSLERKSIHDLKGVLELGTNGLLKTSFHPNYEKSVSIRRELSEIIQKLSNNYTYAKPENDQ